MRSIAALRIANSSAVEGMEIEFIEDLRGLVWSDERTTGRTWQELADDARLSYSTVQKFASGTTKRPHTTTIYKLVQAMGLRFAIVPANLPAMPQEINLKDFRKKK